MPTTDRYGIRYPAQSDPPDGPGAYEKLAKDVDTVLGRAWVCTSSTRPASPGQGFLIYESDTGLLYLYRSGGWRCIGASDELATDMRSIPSGPQNLPANTTTRVAYATNELTSPLVTKAADGAGHRFILSRPGIWALNAILSLPSTTSVDFYAWMLVDGKFGARDVGGTAGRPATRNMATTRRCPKDCVVAVDTFTTAAVSTDGSTNGALFSAAWLGP